MFTSSLKTTAILLAWTACPALGKKWKDCPPCSGSSPKCEKYGRLACWVTSGNCPDEHELEFVVPQERRSSTPCTALEAHLGGNSSRRPRTVLTKWKCNVSSCTRSGLSIGGTMRCTVCTKNGKNWHACTDCATSGAVDGACQPFATCGSCLENTQKECDENHEIINLRTLFDKYGSRSGKVDADKLNYWRKTLGIYDVNVQGKDFGFDIPLPEDTVPHNTVISVKRGSPADTVGVRVGQEIIAIDGTPVNAENFYSVCRKQNTRPPFTLTLRASPCQKCGWNKDKITDVDLQYLEDDKVVKIKVPICPDCYLKFEDVRSDNGKYMHDDMEFLQCYESGCSVLVDDSLVLYHKKHGCGIDFCEEHYDEWRRNEIAHYRLDSRDRRRVRRRLIEGMPPRLLE